MITPPESLLKYDDPVLASKTDRKSPMGRPLRVMPEQCVDSTVPVPPPPKPKPGSPEHRTEEVLNTIFPPREWIEGNQLWVQQVSRAPWTRLDVVQLEELLDIKLKDRQARETGICPVRRELYSQFFDELIRLATISCAESGWLLSRVKNEIQTTIATYQTLHKSAVTFGMRKALQAELLGKGDMEKRISDMENENHELNKQLNELEAECDAIKQKETERRQVEEEKRTREIQFLKRTNQQLQTLLEMLSLAKK